MIRQKRNESKCKKTKCIVIGSNKNTKKVPKKFCIPFQGAKIKPEARVKSLGI